MRCSAFSCEFRVDEDVSAALCAACEGKVTVVMVAVIDLASMWFCIASFNKFDRLGLEESCVEVPRPEIAIAVDSDPYTLISCRSPSYAISLLTLTL